MIDHPERMVMTLVARDPQLECGDIKPTGWIQWAVRYDALESYPFSNTVLKREWRVAPEHLQHEASRGHFQLGSTFSRQPQVWTA